MWRAADSGIYHTCRYAPWLIRHLVGLVDDRHLQVARAEVLVLDHIEHTTMSATDYLYTRV